MICISNIIAIRDPTASINFVTNDVTYNGEYCIEIIQSIANYFTYEYRCSTM